MLAYLVRRFVAMLPLMLGISLVVFGLLELVPGDPAVVLLGDDATPESISQMRELLGLDKPALVRLGLYLGRLIRGDMGTSIFQRMPVLTLVLERLPATAELAIASVLLALLVGVPLGVVAALKKGSAVDAGSMILAQLGVSMPVFWLAILVMYVFAVELNWLPSIGRGEPLSLSLAALFRGSGREILSSLRHLALPAVTLGLTSAAVFSRMTRSSMLSVLSEDYIRTARSKGLGTSRVAYSHALRNALLPLVSVLGIRFGTLLGGAIITESVFGWPGLGRLAVSAISQRDYPLIQGVVLTIAVLFSLVNLLIDMLYAFIDPRIRLE